MKSYKKIFMSATLALAAALPVAMAPATYAVYGPTGTTRPPFSMSNQADYPVFNSITDNTGTEGGQAIGDERDFVRMTEISKSGAADGYVTSLELQPGKRYRVYIYFRNDAKNSLNSETANYAGIANGVKLSATFPATLQKGKTGTVRGTIKANNTKPTEVWAGTTVTAKEDITLTYVDGSAKFYNDWNKDGFALPASIGTTNTGLFSAAGTNLGMANQTGQNSASALDGRIMGGSEYAGHVVYDIEVTKGISETIPDTGPTETILAVCLTSLAAMGAFIFVKARLDLKKVTRQSKGRE